MVRSSGKALGRLHCGLLAWAALAAAPATLPALAAAPTAAAKAAAPLGSRQLPITVDAASSEVDYRTNTVVFSQVVISQGAMRAAQHSTRIVDKLQDVMAKNYIERSAGE